MKFRTAFLTTALIFFHFAFLSSAHGAQYKYYDLVTKDYDEMTSLVESRLNKARALNRASSDTVDSEATDLLRDALKIIFSRPNSDNMVGKLIPEVRRELTGLSAFDDTLSGLAAEAVQNLKNKKSATAYQATSLFILENLLGEIRPEVSNNLELRGIAERIAKAKIDVPDRVINDLKLRGMFKTHNPSDLAKQILKESPIREKGK